MQALSARGSDVICTIQGLPNTVIPAQAGIYTLSGWKYAGGELDSRLRGNDPCFKRDPIPNDITPPRGLRRETMVARMALLVQE